VLVNGFEPCEVDKEPTGDEIVVFDEGFPPCLLIINFCKGQVLPRYIVHYEVIKKAKFTPIALLDSSDDESEEDSIENKLPSVEVVTGEEEENSMLSLIKVKLFELESETKSWKEKGEGELKVNENKTTRNFRISNFQKREILILRVVRTEGVGKVLLNLSIFSQMHSEIRGDKKRDLFIGTFVGTKATSYLIRVF
jgi:hypothetical protein